MVHHKSATLGCAEKMDGVQFVDGKDLILCNVWGVKYILCMKLKGITSRSD